MIKQQQRVIRKGDYYEMQTYEQSMMLISKTKKEEQQNAQNSSPNIVINQQILTEMPAWNVARDQYFREDLTKEQYSDKGLEELVEELERMMKQEQGLRDEERNQIEMLTREIVDFSKSQELQLNNLPAPTTLQQAKSQTSSIHPPVTLTTQYNLSTLSTRISQLQSLDFPQLISLQHQLQIMLGQKKPLQSLQLTHMDQKQKQELNNLYNHLNSLSIMNNTQRVIDSVFSNEAKHVEMQGWLTKMEKVQGLNGDFVAELKEDMEVIKRLQENFGKNVSQVRDILKELKGG